MSSSSAAVEECMEAAEHARVAELHLCSLRLGQCLRELRCCRHCICRAATLLDQPQKATA